MQTGFPELPNPIPETHPTADPGPATYSTRKIALERHLRDHAAVQVTVLRPCAIHGLLSRHLRPAHARHAFVADLKFTTGRCVSGLTMGMLSVVLARTIGVRSAGRSA